MQPRPNYTAIVRLLQQRLPGLTAAYLFGSQASGEASSGSDLDIAVLLPQPLSAAERFELGEELAALVGRDVDLVGLRSASTVLRSQVVARGRALYRAPGTEAEQFEDFVYADYARLNEERAELLRDVRQRGSICGR